MTTLNIRHDTRYRYDRPVSFGVHRLMIRPRDAHDVRLLRSGISIAPAAEIRWEFDVFGNSVALVSFPEMAQELVVRSELVLRRYGLDEAVDSLATRAARYPFAYGEDELIDLAPLLRPHNPEDCQAVEDWVRLAMPTTPDESLEALRILTAAIHGAFAYRRREEYGVQTPAETLAMGSGTCRDFALLFMEAARLLGFAARFVTGYLYDPTLDAERGDLVGGGATHAWADVFVPGAGWVEFDPTNRIIAGRNLVRIATTRTPAQAQPVQGTYVPNGATFLGMEVTVTVAEVE